MFLEIQCFKLIKKEEARGETCLDQESSNDLLSRILLTDPIDERSMRNDCIVLGAQLSLNGTTVAHLQIVLAVMSE
jgi:hypothetical protein